MSNSNNGSPPRVVKNGPYKGQSVRSPSPDRLKRVQNKLLSKFPHNPKKLPLQSAVDGYTKELLLSDHLEKPRDQAQAFNVFDPNDQVGNNFPAVDLFAAPIQQQNQELNMLQSKAHMGPTPMKRKQAFKQDFKKTEQTADSLAKRVHPQDPKQYKKYSNPLYSSLNKLSSSSSKPFERSEDESDNNFYDTVDRKRSELGEFISDQTVYPMSPQTYDLFDANAPVIEQPFHSSTVRNVGNIIPSRKRKKPIKNNNDDDWKMSDESSDN